MPLRQRYHPRRFRDRSSFSFLAAFGLELHFVTRVNRSLLFNRLKVLLFRIEEGCWT